MNKKKAHQSFTSLMGIVRLGTRLNSFSLLIGKFVMFFRFNADFGVRHRLKGRCAMEEYQVESNRVAEARSSCVMTGYRFQYIRIL
jgi:hypothetical protein